MRENSESHKMSCCILYQMEETGTSGGSGQVMECKEMIRSTSSS